MRMSQNWIQWSKTFEQFCLLSGDILRKSGLLAFFSTLRPLQNRWYHPLSNATWRLFQWDIFVMKRFSSEKTECHGPTVSVHPSILLSSLCFPLNYTSRTSWVHVSTGTLWCGASPWALAPWTCALAPLQMPKQRFIVSTRFWTSPFKSLVLCSNRNGEYRTS